MHVGIDQGGRDQTPPGIDLSRTMLVAQIGGDTREATAGDRDVDRLRAAAQPGLADEQVILHYGYDFQKL
jgi:hypothetical protein